MKEISAGGVVFKQEGSKIKVLLIEDRYHRLTIPKGKQEAGETLEQTALREIEEETGIKGEIIQPLTKVYYTYTDPKRGHIDKEVMYYLVKATSGEVEPQLEEINKVFWLDLHSAWQAQQENGYDNNDEVFKQAYTYLQSFLNSAEK
ncbi:NUDIX hydrolase [Caldalkalibacillus thermarum TA2.A1]|uniref:NUDIX hydrolase n=1 Tax=Caldalkalibacillus thermarum (strain TA2.A1) TaxID=986075 RepID=F5L7N3_CALTT|nr:NUDIX hydrolase [Caldalkalibacillus thermarum]EGL82677.1 NUDIX hydrolase [Caldalkalibacillus thermarum TA2.A1]QZT33394.1 NUDIX hydrolase [Caldalkalibacillus thermarum TA2.A1]